MKPQTPKKKTTLASATLMALAVIATVSACSPKPSAEDASAQTKALVEQAVEQTKKEMLAEQAAEKAKQDALVAAQAEEKIKQEAAVAQAAATAKKEAAAKQRATAKAKPHQSSPATPSESYPTPMEKIVCTNCGVVLSIKEVETEGKGSGLGVVAGGVVGGLLGNQVGQGTGRDIATIAGAVGGAIVGNKIEKNVKKTKSYNITVKMDTGEERVVHQTAAPNVAIGDAIKIENDVIVKR